MCYDMYFSFFTIYTKSLYIYKYTMYLQIQENTLSRQILTSAVTFYDGFHCHFHIGCRIVFTFSILISIKHKYDLILFA